MKRFLLPCIVCALIAATLFPTAASERELPIYCVDTPQKTCAISFDAAWGDVRVRQYYFAQKIG